MSKKPMPQEEAKPLRKFNRLVKAGQAIEDLKNPLNLIYRQKPSLPDA